MPRVCEVCREPIAFLDAQTSSGSTAWHTCCWNETAEERRTFFAELDEGEGFRFRPSLMSLRRAKPALAGRR